MAGLYNEKEKKEFLSTIDYEYSRFLYEILFKRSKSAEELYGKDLYTFNLDQIDLVMRNINPSTYNSVTNNKSRINSYISWAIKNGRRENNLNPLHGTGNEWADKFIDKTTKRYLSSYDLDDLIESLYNAQDQALIQCIFEGLSGEKMSELVSLNVDNIDWDSNMIRVEKNDQGEYRTVRVSDRCIELIRRAHAETIYKSEDTESESELIENNGVVFKNTQWRSTKKSFMTERNLAQRIKRIKDKYELDELSTTTISVAGRIRMAADIYIKTGRLEKDELTIIGDQFDLPVVRTGDYEYYNTSAMRKYINKENLKELYNIEADI